MLPSVTNAPTPTLNLLCERVPAQVFRSDGLSDGKGDIRAESRIGSLKFFYGSGIVDNASSRRRDKAQMSEANKREASYILGHSEAERPIAELSD
jgi:hypothetical protein